MRPDLHHPAGFLRAFTLTLAIVLLSACSSPGTTSFYLLEGGAGPRPETTPRAGPILGLREIALPLYARRPQIASLQPGGIVTLSDDHRWAEDPGRAVSRMVARNLTTAAGIPVLLEPWPNGVTPDLRLEVEIDYFIGSLDGALRLEGEYHLANTGAFDRPTTRPFAITTPVEPAPENPYGALVAAHATALGMLSTRIAEDITALAN
ncbi:MAG: PqiC family protein [Pseudomonadota bacterium]